MIIINRKNYRVLEQLVEFEDIGLREYGETWSYQEQLFNELLLNKKERRENGTAVKELPNRLIFVEHPHVYTLGKSGSDNNLLLDYIQLQAKDATFFRIDRGGDITYHGPGQIVGYPIFDIERFGLSLKDYIFKLEEAIIVTLKEYGIDGGRLEGSTGVWLESTNPERVRKICAIGVRASRYVTMHGFAFNVNTNLEYFNFINPCGFKDKGVTSLEKELGEKQNFDEVKEVLRKKIKEVFGIDWANEN